MLDKEKAPYYDESARLYWDLRWLGDRPEWTVAESLLPRLERVEERAARLGYLS